MTKTFIAPNIESLLSVAKDIILAIDKTRVVCLYGEMGAGKTTLVKALIAELDAQDIGNSPTFSLINNYTSAIHGNIFHLDLYRLSSLEEAFGIGVEEVLYDNHWCFIEWPECILTLLPSEYAVVSITVNDEGTREITLELTNNKDF